MESIPTQDSPSGFGERIWLVELHALQIHDHVSPRVVMDVLNHSQIGLTMNTYAHVIPDLKRDAARKMDELLEHER